jgi:hypothetical protein
MKIDSSYGLKEGDQEKNTNSGTNVDHSLNLRSYI